MSRVCSFDALNRLTSLASVAHGPSSNLPVTAYSYTYEPKRSLITSIHNAISGARQTNLYDAAGQLIGVDNTRYTYDAAGRLVGVTTTNAALSAQDQHSSLAYGAGNTIASLGVASNIASVTLDVACASPLALTNWLVAANGVPACSSIWRQTQTDFIISNVPLGGQQLFVRVRLDGRAPVMHDAAGWSHWGTHQPATNNQLHFAVEPAAIGDADRVPVNAYATHTYTYDAAGQLLSRQAQVASFQDQVSYRYDAARNMVQCHGNGFTNRYQYDYLRRLNRQVHEGTDGITSNSFVYDGLDMIVKIDEMSGEIVCFTRGLGIAPGVGDPAVGGAGVLAETHILGASTQSFFYITNHRGDTVALVDESGDVVGTYAYDAWGNPISSIQQPGSPAPYFTFSSKHYDENAGLYYYGFRWYDPVSKRWTQPDPEGLSEGLDLYQFCGNEPVNTIDAYGLWKCVGVTKGGRRKLYQFEEGDTAQGLADLVGLDVNEIHKWMRIEQMPCPGQSSPWVVSVPNVWIAADLLRGWQAEGAWWQDAYRWPWDKAVNVFGDVGELIFTDFGTFGYEYVHPNTAKSLYRVFQECSGDIIGVSLFAHGDEIGRIYESDARHYTYQGLLISSLQQGGYKIARAYLMQCYSGYSGRASVTRGNLVLKGRVDWEGRWKKAVVKKGLWIYKGWNALLLDLE